MDLHAAVARETDWVSPKNLRHVGLGADVAAQMIFHAAS